VVPGSWAHEQRGQPNDESVVTVHVKKIQTTEKSRRGESNAAVNARQVRINQDYHKKAKDLDTRLGGDQQGGFEAELSTFGRDGVVLRPVVGTLGNVSTHIDLLADVIADALTAEHLSYYGDRGSKTALAYYRRVLYRAWRLTAHRGWARLILDRRSLVQAPNTPRDQSQHPRARNDYDEEAAYESNNPRARLPIRPGGLCRRRLDGTLSVNY